MITVASLAPFLGGALALGGVAVAASRRRELMIRWCAWAVGVPLVTGAFWWGEPGTAAVAVVVGVIAVLEFGGLMLLGRVDRAVLAAAVAGVVLTAWLAPGEVLRALAVGALTVAAVPLVTGDAEHGLRRLGAGLLGLAWLSVLAALVPSGQARWRCSWRSRSPTSRRTSPDDGSVGRGCRRCHRPSGGAGPWPGPRPDSVCWPCCPR